MHRWGQSQMFRALAYYLAEAGRQYPGEILSDKRNRAASKASEAQVTPLRGL
jgi:hypothetical protein